MKKLDDLGDRMKSYERSAETRLNLSMPICARIDGRAFSGFTRGCEKPFDGRVSGAMRETCAYLVEKTHAAIGYVQSDEISLAWFAVNGGSILFDGKVQKMTSVIASMAAVKFHSVFGGNGLPSFDCRVWNVPDKTEAANVFLWRAIDSRKNAISSACATMFSPKQMHKQHSGAMIEMMASAGVDFDNHYAHTDIHGAYFRRVTREVEIDDATLAAIPERHRPESRLAMRSSVEMIAMPYLIKVKNRETVIFDAADPVEGDGIA